MYKSIVCGLAAVMALPIGAMAQEVSGKTTRLPDLVVGTGDSGYGFTHEKMPTLETGKSYRMWLKATGKKECAFEADELFANVKWRKIEVNKVEIKPTGIQEIEFENEGSAELFFTPTKAGEYKWVCKGFEAKGLTGKIIVK